MCLFLDLGGEQSRKFKQDRKRNNNYINTTGSCLMVYHQPCAQPSPLIKKKFHLGQSRTFHINRVRSKLIDIDRID